MSTNANGSNTAQTPYLITSRFFPKDVEELQPVLTKSWVDLAQAINTRTIGIFNTTSAVNGDKYYNATNTLQLRQAYRQTFPFGAIAAGGTIAIFFDMTQVTQCVNIYGTVVTDDVTSKFRALNWTSSTDITEQIQVDFNSIANQINITVGAGAPNVISGMIVVEYLLN